MNPAEIIAAVELLKELEPEAQKAIVGLIHLFHKKKQPKVPVPGKT